MSDRDGMQQHGGYHGASDRPAGAGGSPGKRTLTGAIQRRSNQGAGARDGEAGTGAGLPASGGGAAMPVDVRAQLEGAFGVDLSPVRIHEGPHAAQVGALAYTQGTDIHFAPGQYQPHSPAGQALLGHELTHVVQQAQGRVAATAQAKGVAINDDAGLEREADDAGARAARGQPVRVGDGAPGTLASAGALAPLQRFGFAPLFDPAAAILGPSQAAERMQQIDAWLAPMLTAPALRQARLDVEAAPANAPFALGPISITMDSTCRALLNDAIRRRLMERVGAVRAPFAAPLAAAADATARRAVQDQQRAAARPFLDELRDPAQPGARFQHPDPAVQREVLAALTLDGEGHAEDELIDQATHGADGPRSRARAVGHLPSGAWCGAFTYTQQRGAGLSEDARGAMHATGPHEGIDAFLDYEHRRQVIWTGTTWQLVRDYHAERSSLRHLTRLPTTPTALSATATAPGLDLQPGDLVLIDNFRGTYADHITQCRSYDPATGQLETIAGNEGGGAGHVAASAAPRDLNHNPAAQTVTGYNKPGRVYAYGRFSIVDYEVHTYLTSMPSDPSQSPETLAAQHHSRGHGRH